MVCAAAGAAAAATCPDRDSEGLQTSSATAAGHLCLCQPSLQIVELPAFL